MSQTKSGPKVKAKAAEPKQKAVAPAETKSAAKSEAKPDAKADAAKPDAPKADATTAEASKSDAPKAEAPKNYHRGEGQKPVTQAYKDNWNAIFGATDGKKAKKKKR